MIDLCTETDSVAFAAPTPNIVIGWLRPSLYRKFDEISRLRRDKERYAMVMRLEIKGSNAAASNQV
jgi:cellobiose phosphorylase